jgi:hypothetical protein
MSEWAKRLTKGNERMATYPTTEAVKQFIVGHKEHLKTYTALLSAADAVESALIIDFAAGLESALRAAFGSQEWSVANNVDEGCFSSNAEPEILVRKHSWVGYAVGIAANSIGERFGYGVRREGRPRDESEDRIVKQLGSGMTGESPWFWYRYAPRLHGIDGSRWRNHESLKAMHDDETRSEILAELVSLIASVAKIVSRELEDNNVVMLQSNER